MVLVSDINSSVLLPTLRPTLLNDANGVKFLFGLFDVVFDFFKHSWIILWGPVDFFVLGIGNLSNC